MRLLGLRAILDFAPFQAFWEPFFTRCNNVSAHTNSVAKMAKPTMMNAMPGPGSTNNAIPTRTKVPPMMATVSQRSGWGAGAREPGPRAGSGHWGPARAVATLAQVAFGPWTPFHYAQCRGKAQTQVRSPPPMLRQSWGQSGQNWPHD